MESKMEQYEAIRLDPIMSPDLSEASSVPAATSCQIRKLTDIH